MMIYLREILVLGNCSACSKGVRRGMLFAAMNGSTVMRWLASESVVGCMLDSNNFECRNRPPREKRGGGKEHIVGAENMHCRGKKHCLLLTKKIYEKARFMYPITFQSNFCV
jgi:hypothetical protein